MKTANVQKNPIRFGTGGWRGIIGDDFIKENIRRVAMGIGLLAKEEGKTDKPIVIGYDRRFLSQTATEWITETLNAMGFHTILMERSTPTPLIMYLVLHHNLHYGIEVTASHNPAAYNGIKLIVEEGRDAPLETTARLEELIAEQECEPPVEEIARRLDAKKEDVIHAMEAIIEPISLYEPVFNDNGDALYLMDQLADSSGGDEQWLENIALREAMTHLSERERRIVNLRFFGNKTQMEIATEIGISQAQVSRLEKGALEKIRQQM